MPLMPMPLMPTPTSPTLLFIGVSTGQSSIRAIFPHWAQALGIDAVLEGCDLPPSPQRAALRQVVEWIRDRPQVRGALVTTHKIDVHTQCADLFDTIDDHARRLGEIGCVVKRDGVLIGHSIDHVTGGLALEQALGAHYWQRHPQAEVFIIGAGGAATALSAYLQGAAKGNNRPARIVVSDIQPTRIEAIRALHGTFPNPIPGDYVVARSTADNNAVIRTLPPNSLIVNATGMGKDRPGSPIDDAVSLPEQAVIWDFNYRGGLGFLTQAIRQREARKLRIVDGWDYFLHGWLQVIAQVFDVRIAHAGSQFERLSSIAAEIGGHHSAPLRRSVEKSSRPHARVRVDYSTIPLAQRLRDWHAARRASVHIWWLGQSGFLIGAGDDMLCLDPYLSDSLRTKYIDTGPDHTRMMPPPITPERLGNLRAILCSHSHSDHMDPEALPQLIARNPQALVVIPATERAYARRLGIPPERIVAIDASAIDAPAIVPIGTPTAAPAAPAAPAALGGAATIAASPHGIAHQIRIGAATVRAIPAAHETLERDERGHSRYLGFLIDIGGVTIWYSGDSVLYPRLSEHIGLALRSIGRPAIDLALLPVNGRGARLSGHSSIMGNFTLEEAWQLCRDLAIPTFLGCHYGMFAFNTIDPQQATQWLSRQTEPPRGMIAELSALYRVEAAD